jgi:hypothetical protein
MRKNENLHSAKKAKNDEFYTQLTDIEKELMHYRNQFKDKVVLCNCNDALHTGFAKHFSMAFEVYGLKELICTSFNPDGQGMVYRYHGDTNGNNTPDVEEWDKMPMEGNGGFNTPEGIALIDEADIIVTNPPFSLFREFIALLMEHNKKFLVIGNGNAVTYKEIFPLIKDNKLWLGAGKGMGGKAMEFYVDESIYDASKGSVNRVENGKCYVGVMMCTWFTNLDHTKRHEPLDLYKKYNPEEYPKYDNYDAINVDKVCEIPLDYDGVMGVPISFLDKYCPEQFEIVWTTDRGGDGELEDLKVKDFDKSWDSAWINGQKVYKRIFIKHKK